MVRTSNLEPPEIKKAVKIKAAFEDIKKATRERRASSKRRTAARQADTLIAKGNLSSSEKRKLDRLQSEASTTTQVQQFQRPVSGRGIRSGDVSLLQSTATRKQIPTITKEVSGASFVGRGIQKVRSVAKDLSSQDAGIQTTRVGRDFNIASGEGFIQDSFLVSSPTSRRETSQLVNVFTSNEIPQGVLAPAEKGDLTHQLGVGSEKLRFKAETSSNPFVGAIGTASLGLSFAKGFSAPVVRPVETFGGLLLTVAEPQTVLPQIREQAASNPLGFLSEQAGAVTAFGAIGKGIKNQPFKYENVQFKIEGEPSIKLDLKPNEFIHGTSQSNLNSIFRDGLKATDKSGFVDNALFLTKKLDVAKIYGDSILKVTLNKGQVKSLTSDFAGSEFILRKGVKSSQVSLLEPSPTFKTESIKTLGIDFGSRGQPLISLTSEGFKFGTPKFKNQLSPTALESSVQVPITASGTKGFLARFDLAPAELTRVKSIIKASRIVKGEKGLLVEEALFNVEGLKNPKSASVIVENIAGNEGVLFGRSEEALCRERV